jgi:hypothetical protein
VRDKEVAGEGSVRQEDIVQMKDMEIGTLFGHSRT